MAPKSLPSFHGVFNLREIGGYATQAGRRPRRGLLFRSSALHDLGEATNLGIRTVSIFGAPQMWHAMECAWDRCATIPTSDVICYLWFPILLAVNPPAKC